MINHVIVCSSAACADHVICCTKIMTCKVEYFTLFIVLWGQIAVSPPLFTVTSFGWQRRVEFHGLSCTFHRIARLGAPTCCPDLTYKLFLVDLMSLTSCMIKHHNIIHSYGFGNELKHFPTSITQPVDLHQTSFH